MRIATAFVALSLLPAAALAQRHEGKWEITMTATMNGMAMPPHTIVKCLTKDDLSPVEPRRAQGCKTDVKQHGDKVEIHMTCTDPRGGTTEGSGEMTFQKDRFDGTMRMTAAGPDGRPMQMTQVLSGKRLGACQ